MSLVGTAAWYRIGDHDGYWFARVLDGEKTEVVCMHRHTSRFAAERCADRMAATRERRRAKQPKVVS